MKQYRVVVSAEAQRDLFSLFDWIGNLAGEKTARTYVQRLRIFTQSLGTAPARGRSIDYIGPGMRILGFERRVTIVFAVNDDRVIIIRYFGFGRDWKSEFEPTSDPVND
jgi:toxin ParE1/3/4